ncbi:hypothetical protein K438DRAFT_566924 [Mycena galopus ATCC 62051]|nr:hypothetical protein K438DRAFT_566924 [Mycena galopus ATCC 62051]
MAQGTEMKQHLQPEGPYQGECWSCNTPTRLVNDSIESLRQPPGATQWLIGHEVAGGCGWLVAGTLISFVMLEKTSALWFLFIAGKLILVSRLHFTAKNKLFF